MRFNDPELVAREYASEEKFARRRAVFADLVDGEIAEDLAIEALRETRPRRVLEVGCGLGEFAVRVRREIGADVVAIDSSSRMVEVARERGVDASIGDAQELAFRDEEFDCVVANWVLHHVPDLDRALGEITRVLGPHGRLTAATFSEEHLSDLFDWLGEPSIGELEFSSENGADPLGRHFARVERRDARGTVRFPDRAAVLDYLNALVKGAEVTRRLPEFEGGYAARSRQSVFVADKP